MTSSTKHAQLNSDCNQLRALFRNVPKIACINTAIYSRLKIYEERWLLVEFLFSKILLF